MFVLLERRLCLKINSELCPSIVGKQLVMNIVHDWSHVLPNLQCTSISNHYYLFIKVLLTFLIALSYFKYIQESKNVIFLWATSINFNTVFVIILIKIQIRSTSTNSKTNGIFDLLWNPAYCGPINLVMTISKLA